MTPAWEVLRRAAQFLPQKCKQLFGQSETASKTSVKGVLWHVIVPGLGGSGEPASFKYSLLKFGIFFLNNPKLTVSELFPVCKDPSELYELTFF